LSALTGGVCVASCKGPRNRRPRVKRPPIGGSPWHERCSPLAQLSHKLPKARIVRGSLNSSERAYLLQQEWRALW
jgi:hypothetical protein